MLGNPRLARQTIKSVVSILRRCTMSSTNAQGLVYPTTTTSATDLLSALPAKFEQAKQSGELYFFPSEAKDIYSAGKRVRIGFILPPAPLRAAELDQG